MKNLTKERFEEVLDRWIPLLSNGVEWSPTGGSSYQEHSLSWPLCFLLASQRHCVHLIEGNLPSIKCSSIVTAVVCYLLEIILKR